MVVPPRPSLPTPLHITVAGRLRTAAARYRLLRITAVVTIALVVAATLERAHDRAADAEAAWTTTGSVLVAAADIPAGELLGPASITAMPVPAGLRPPDALTDVEPGARTMVDLAVGEILRSSRVDREAGSGLAAVLPDDHLAFTIPADDTEAVAGDVVRLYDLTTNRVAVDGARVLNRHDDMITVAVPERNTRDLVAALGTGGTVVAIIRPAVNQG